MSDKRLTPDEIAEIEGRNYHNHQHGYGMAIDDIDALLSDRRARGWLEIDDTTPVNTSLLLGTDKWVCEGYRVAGEGNGEDGNFYAANTHWTDAHDGQLHPTHYRLMPTPPSAKEAGNVG